MDRKAEKSGGSRSTSRMSGIGSNSRLHLGGGGGGGGLSRNSKSFIGSKGSLYSGSRRGINSENSYARGMRSDKVALIFNEKGEDITPKPLIAKTEPTSKKNQSDTASSSDLGQPQSMFDNASFMQTVRSMFGGSIMDGGAGGSVMGGSVMGGSLMGASLMGGSFMGGSGMEGVAPMTRSRSSGMSSVHEDDEVLSPEDLEEMVNISLSETDTIWLLDIPSTWVALDSEEAETVTEQNKQYLALCKSRHGNDRYSERGMGTFSGAPKSKCVQTEPVVKQTAEVYTSDWEIYDTLNEKQMNDKDKLKDTSSSHVTASHVTSRAPTGSTRPQTNMSTIGGGGGGASNTVSIMGGSVASSIFNVTMGPSMSVYGPGGVAQGVDEEKEELDPSKPNDHPILQLSSLMDSFRVVERAVTQNVYQSKQARYRDLPIIRDPNDPSSAVEGYTISAPHLSKLWSFKCPLTRARAVTCIAWNTVNKDIFAVGYGKFNTSGDDTSSQGLVCCWSLKNPEHPERVFYATSGVTSLSFSHHHPNLLAVALYNGSLVMYNCRSTSHEPVLTSRDALFKHSGPVWQIDWVVKERSLGEDRSEVLVSVGTDGRILQWSIRKGFESQQLMKLKRMMQSKQNEKKHSQSRAKAAQIQQQQKAAKHKQGGGKRKQQEKGGGAIAEHEAYISQHAPAMGFAFSSVDTNIYLVCTEEGYVHKCSCSYNEQYLETYTGHSGPIYRVQWHPSFHDIFLTCSSDWSMSLWDQDKPRPLYTLQVTQKQDVIKSTHTSKKKTDEKVMDHSSQESVWNIDWSPHDPTVFGSVRGGRVEIWNMKSNILDPIIVHKPVSGIRQTFIKFSHNSDVILVGDVKGEVSVYVPKNIPPSPANKVKAFNSVLESLQSSKTK